MNLFSEDRHAPARAEARLCGPRTGRAGKVERTGVDRTSRREGRATSRVTCATLGPVPHLGNFHPQYPKRRWAASTPPDSLCSRHPTSPSARLVSGHPSRRHQRRPVPSALLRGVAPYRRPAPSRVWSQSRRTCRMPEYGNTGTHTVSDSFLRGEEGVWQGGLRRRARKNPLCSRSVRSGGRFSRCPQRSALRSLSSG
jgi:hypothetical protein